MKRYVEIIEVEAERERSLMMNGVMMILYGVMAAIMTSFANNYLGFDCQYLLTSVLFVGGLGSILCGLISGEKLIVE